MKRIVFLLLLTGITQFGYTQYTTPGSGVNWDMADLMNNASGAITQVGAAFHILQDITISSNDTLNIITDEIIKVAQGKRINVSGALICNPMQEVLFSAIDTTQRFKGFRFENSVGSLMRKATIEYGGGIKLVSSHVVFEDCIIRYNDKSNCTGSIDASTSNPMILGCTFHRNAGPAVASGANGSSSPQIRNCQIIHNNTANTNAPQINLGMMGSDSIRIVGNLIDGFYNMAGGIAVSTLAGGNILARIDSNIVINNRYGIACIGSNIQATIRYNYIADNNTQGIPNQGGSGLNFNGGLTNNATLAFNEVSGNLWGVTIQGTALPNLGQVEPDTLNIGRNQFYNNGNSGQPYNLYNNTPNPIKAENNYWGTYAIDTVENTIFHQPDDPGLGMVDFLPISPMTTGIAYENIPFTVSSLIDVVYPNPASNMLYVRISKTFSENIQQGRLYIVDKNGRILHHQVIPPFLTDIGIDVSAYTEGLYFLKVECAQQKETRSIVIIK